MIVNDYRYMAGFFDGEGSIMISFHNRGKGIRYHLYAAVAQSREKGKQICEDFKLCFGGSIQLVNKQKKSHHSQVYSWSVAVQQACKFLERIYPYLRIKKEQAELAIEFAKKTSNYKGKCNPSEIERIEKYSYYETAKQEMQFLNNSFWRSRE